jgi:hypothetical protein
MIDELTADQLDARSAQNREAFDKAVRRWARRVGADPIR